MVASAATTTSTPVRSQSRESVALPRVKDLSAYRREMYAGWLNFTPGGVK